MSDDFDDEEVQHRLVIDDPESSENNNQNAGKSKDILKFDGSENGNMKDRSGNSNSPEPMDTSPATDNNDTVGNGHATDNSLSRSSNVESSKHNIIDSDSDSSHNALTDKASLNNFLSPTTKKRKKMTDKSTCVLTKSCQVEDGGLNLLSLKNGSTACINITIVCKTGGNAMFIVAKWRGREYHGILTDGEHPVELHATNVHKKHLSADKSVDHFTGATNSPSHSNAGKARGKRGGRVSDKKNRHHESQESDDGESGNKPGIDDTAGSKLVEVLDKSYVRCPHAQCGFRFNSVSDLNTHTLFAHVEAKAKLTESVATQTSVNTIDSSTDNCANDSEFVSAGGDGAKSLCAKCKRAVTSPSATSQSATDSSKTGHNVTIIEADQTGSVEDLFKAVRSQQTTTGRGGAIGQERHNIVESVAKSESIAKDGNTPSAFSDISDDGAPMLEKEESFDKGADTSKKTDEPLNIIGPSTATGMLGDNLSRPVGSQNSGSGTAKTTSPPSPTVIKSGQQDDVIDSGANLNAITATTSNPGSAAVAFANLTQQQLMAGLMPPGTNMQQMAALLSAASNTGGLPSASNVATYATPFQSNFQLNSSFFPINIPPAVAAAAAAQQFPVNPAVGGKAPPGLVGIPQAAAGFGVSPSSIAASFAAVASNGLNPAISSSSSGSIAQQKSANVDSLSAQRHKIYELKSGSATTQPQSSSTDASHLLASPVPGRSSKDGAIDAAANAGRLSSMAGGSEAPSPLRPSSSSAFPSASVGQRNAFKRPPTNSPGCNAAAAVSAQPFLGGLTAGIPPNLAASSLLNPQHLNPQLLFSPQQQQQIQQLNQFRQMSNFLTPEIAAQAAQYAAMLVAPQTAAPFAQQPQPTTQSQPQFPQPPHK